MRVHFKLCYTTESPHLTGFPEYRRVQKHSIWARLSLPKAQLSQTTFLFFPSIPPSPYPLHEVSDLSLSSSSSLVLKQHQELLRGRSILTPTGLERGFAEMREPQEEKLKKKKFEL